jgi:hypothetical protein
MTDSAFRLPRATETEFEAFLMFTANIQRELQNVCGPWMRKPQVILAEVAADTSACKSIRVNEVQAAIEGYLRGVERSEDYFRPIGRKLSHATHCGTVNTNTVDALFQVLPRLVEVARPTSETTDADSLDKHFATNMKDFRSENPGTVSVLPATWLCRFGKSQRPFPADKVRSDTIFESIILPFWSSGRWHVAVLRPAEDAVVVIDPWGLYTSKDIDVGHIMRSVVRACILTRSLPGYSFVTS